MSYSTKLADFAIYSVAASLVEVIALPLRFPTLFFPTAVVVLFGSLLYCGCVVTVDRVDAVSEECAATVVGLALLFVHMLLGIPIREAS